MAYDYRKHLYYFIPSKDSKSAATRRSSESSIQFTVRQTKELVNMALKARNQRGYKLDEAVSIYKAFSRYTEIVPKVVGYDVQQGKIGISYIILLSGYIVGDKTVSSSQTRVVINALDKLFTSPGIESDSMYPSTVVTVDLDARSLMLGGVRLSPRDMKDILLSFGGRGATLDFEGLAGPAPEWLIEEVLTPTGYISKTPKIPD